MTQRCAWIAPKGYTCLRTREEHPHMEPGHGFTTPYVPPKRDGTDHADDVDAALDQVARGE